VEYLLGEPGPVTATAAALALGSLGDLLDDLLLLVWVETGRVFGRLGVRSFGSFFRTLAIPWRIL
jgi:hypothetical protein